MFYALSKRHSGRDCIKLTGPRAVLGSQREDPQSLRWFLLHALPEFRAQLHRFNDRLLQRFIHQPKHRSRVILDLDSPVAAVFGRQKGAAVGYNPHYRGKRSYDPLLCLEANSAFMLDTELRPGDAGTWSGSCGLLAGCFLSLPSEVRELRVRADAGFGYAVKVTARHGVSQRAKR